MGCTVSDKSVHVKFRVNKYTAQYLIETLVSKDQECQEEGDDSVIVTATVLDTLKLRLRLRLRLRLQGYGGYVEVLEPADLREVLTNLAKEMVNLFFVSDISCRRYMDNATHHIKKLNYSTT